MSNVLADRDVGDRARGHGIARRQPLPQQLRVGPCRVDPLDRCVDHASKRQVRHRRSPSSSVPVSTSAPSASRRSVQKRVWNSSQSWASRSAAGLSRHTRSRPPRFACHEAGAFENAEVFRHSGEGEGKRPGEIADGGSPRGETTEDGAASGIGERVKDAVQIMFNHVVERTGICALIQPSRLNDSLRTSGRT